MEGGAGAEAVELQRGFSTAVGCAEAPGMQKTQMTSGVDQGGNGGDPGFKERNLGHPAGCFRTDPCDAKACLCSLKGVGWLF